MFGYELLLPIQYLLSVGRRTEIEVIKMCNELCHRQQHRWKGHQFWMPLCSCSKEKASSIEPSTCGASQTGLYMLIKNQWELLVTIISSTSSKCFISILSLWSDSVPQVLTYGRVVNSPTGNTWASGWCFLWPKTEMKRWIPGLNMEECYRNVQLYFNS